MKKNLANLFSALRGRRFKWFAFAGLVAAAVLVGGGLAVKARPHLENRNGVTVVEGGGIRNMRDLGGMKTVDGRTVKPGMIYRSGAFNSMERDGHPKSWTISKASCEFLTQRLGIKTDLDLRKDNGETQGMTGSPLGKGVFWAHIPGRSYARVGLPDGKESFAKAFRLFLDESRYPIVVHCQRGRDRAGTLIALLEALLGVPQERIRQDYGFSWTDKGHPHLDYGKFDEIPKVLEEYPGSNLNERAAAFAKSLGFSDADLARFRAIVLEK